MTAPSMAISAARRSWFSGDRGFKYLLIWPAVLIILLIGLFPLIYSLLVSFQNVTIFEEDTSFHPARIELHHLIQELLPALHLLGENPGRHHRMTERLAGVPLVQFGVNGIGEEQVAGSNMRLVRKVATNKILIVAEAVLLDIVREQ